MVVIEGTGLDGIGIGIDSLFRGKGGQPPASKASVEAMPRVEIREGEEGEGGECVICLEEFGVGSFLKKMPCQHGFHEECIEKWLGIHGSCPVCRYKMPVVDDKEGRESGEDGVSVRVDRQIWVSFSVRRDDGRRRRADDDSDDDDDDDDDGDRPEGEDQTVENESDEMES